MDPLNEAGSVIAASREPIRAHVTQALTRAILTGEIGPREVVSVAAAGRLLGVSPTPVREALVELSQQGLVEVQPGRGFTVRGLDADELRGLYETINGLEIVALRLEPVLSSELLAELEAVNDRLRVSEPGLAALEIDARWHAALVSECGNAVLQETLHGLRTRARRYEARYMAEANRVSQSAQQHDAILAALRDGRLEQALEHLEDNWLGGIASAVLGLEENPPRSLRGLVR